MNYQRRTNNFFGFTLIELLVVVAVLGVIGSLVIIIFISTLRGTNKSQIISIIKQNGQSVLESMDKTVRNSDYLVCPIITPPDMSASSNNLVVSKGGFYTRYRIVIEDEGANGYIIQDSPGIGAGENDTTFKIRVCNPDDLINPGLILTDTKTDTGVSVMSGLFTRSEKSGFEDIVTIEFTIGSGVSAPEVVAGQIDPVSFQTTIELR